MRLFYDADGDEIVAYDKEGNVITPQEGPEYVEFMKQCIATGTAMGKMEQVADENIFFQVVPEGFYIKKLDLNDSLAKADALRRQVAIDNWEHENNRPFRNVGTVNLSDVDSFVAMIAREMIPETTIVNANIKRNTFLAIINHAASGVVAGYGDRQLTLDLEYTTEFLRWIEKDRKRVTQLQLADFLEENLESIVDPPAAAMIEMISNLKVKRNASYSSVIDTGTGEQSVSFQENIKGEMQNGSMDFVGKFTIALTPYQGSKPYSIDCNLRFSVDNEMLLIFFSMINLTKVKEHAFDAENEKVREALKALEVPVYNVK